MSFENSRPVENNLVNAISPIEEIIEDARIGKMFILVDHEELIALSTFLIVTLSLAIRRFRKRLD